MTPVDDITSYLVITSYHSSIYHSSLMSLTLFMYGMQMIQLYMETNTLLYLKLMSIVIFNNWFKSKINKH